MRATLGRTGVSWRDLERGEEAVGILNSSEPRMKHRRAATADFADSADKDASEKFLPHPRQQRNPRFIRDVLKTSEQIVQSPGLHGRVRSLTLNHVSEAATMIARLRPFWSCALLLVTIFGSPSPAAPPTTAPVEGLRENTPAVFALTNLRIVTEPGKTIDKGTIVIRDGVI